MATITASAYNDAAARTAGEAMTINNGAEWTVRTDYRVHANAPASNLGALGSVTINEGKFIWDSTNTRWLAYNSGSGNVPAIGTTISQGGVSGYLLGVWASKTVAQTAVGAAMPATGFIKFREVTGGTFAAGALTGIGASATGADVQGWLSLPHDAAANFTIPRLGEHRARGGRFFLENTNGSVGQIFQVPTDGSAAFLAPGLWIETGVATDQYEYWPSLYGSTNGWAHQHIGEAQGSSDARQKFLKAVAGGQLQMGEAYTQASTYASLAAQAGTYAGIAYSATYTRTNNVIEVFYASGHLLVAGQQIGLDFTSGAATDGTFTVVDILSPYHITVASTGADTSGNVTVRPGVTVTFTAHGLNIGDQVYCDFTSGSGVDGTYTIYAVPSANTYLISYPHTAAITSGNVSCLHTVVVTFTAHGMAVGNKVYLDFTSGTGVDGEYTIYAVPDANTYRVNMAHSATTSGNVTMRRQIGLVVEAGRRTWIPSNIVHEVATGARATNTAPNATIASRPEWVTTAAGAIDLEYVYGCSGYLSLTQAYSARIRNCAFFDSINLVEIATALDVDNLHTSMAGALDLIPLSITSCFAGGLVENGRFERGNTPGASDHACSVTYCNDITIDSCQFGIIQYARSSGKPVSALYCSGVALNNSRIINGDIAASVSSGFEINDLDYCDRYTGRTNGTSGSQAINLAGGAMVDAVVNGLTFGFGGTIEDCHPLSYLVSLGATTGVKVRNIGSRSAPVNTGTWAKNAYSLNTLIYSVGNWSNAAIQRVYVSAARTGLLQTTNTDSGALIESVFAGDGRNLGTMAAQAVNITALNQRAKGVLFGPSANGQTSVYGTHWADFFLGSGYGQVMLEMNEPTVETAPYFSMVSGAAKYNSSGGILMGTIGDQGIWEMPYFALGHTGFPSAHAVTMSGGTIGNYTLEFQYDIGSGWNGTWTVLSAANLAAITVDPAVGFKLKIRITTTATNTTAITKITLWTRTTPAAQDNLYPLDRNTITFTGLPTGCDMVVLEAGTTNVLYQLDEWAGTTLSYTYSGADTVDVGFIKPGYVPLYIRNLALTTTDSSIPVALSPDRNYA